MRKILTLFGTVAVASLLLASGGRAQAAGDYLMFVGTYTGPASKGIYAYRYDSATARATPIGLAAETPSPSFLAVHPNGRFLYAANEHEPGDGPGKPDAISAFEIDRTGGHLRFLNKVSSQGEGPCHVSVDGTGKTLFVANYGSGSIAAVSILPDGRLGPSTAFDQHKGSSVDPARQTGPHAHSIAASPDNRFVLSADLGLDHVFVYRFDAANGTLTANAPPFGSVPPGSGPRHFTFHPNGHFVFVNNEMASTVTAFAYDASAGGLTPLQTISTRPASPTGKNSTAEILTDRSGRFLYVTNRGDDNVAVFTADPASGRLTLAQHAPTNGKTPRFMTLDPAGTHLLAANQESSSVIEYDVNPSNGRLTQKAMIADVPTPVSIVFVPSNH